MKALVAAMCGTILTVGFAGSARPEGYVTVTPGPDFTTRVNTPWGNYIVDVEPDGGAAWVGTEAEYVNRKAQAVFRRQGYKEMHIDGAPKNEHYMVSTRLPTVQLGSLTLAGIQSAIEFESHVDFDPSFHAPPPRKGYKYAFVIWQASGRSPVHALLHNHENKRTFHPFNCENGSNAMCRWQIPESELGVPLTVLFMADKKPPAAVPIPSLAYLAYQSETSDRTIPPDERRLAQLRKIDPSIPASIERP
jgi:hypothetical protein